MNIEIKNIPSDFSDAVICTDRSDPEQIHVVHHESNGTDTRFVLTRQQVMEIPDHWDDGLIRLDPSQAPIQIFAVPSEKGVGGHYWMTPNHVRKLKQLVGGGAGQ